MNGKPWSIATLTKTHKRIALDSNILIYVLEGHDQFGRLAAAVIDSIEADDVTGTMSTFGEFEVLAGPARAGDAARFERAADEIRSIGLQMIPLHSDVAADAAWLRGTGGLRPGDAIHVGSARIAGATVIVTNDDRIAPRPGLDVAYLADLSLADDPA
jgi:predicted nucleic acid-binding protein